MGDLAPPPLGERADPPPPPQPPEAKIFYNRNSRDPTWSTLVHWELLPREFRGKCLWILG